MQKRLRDELVKFSDGWRDDLCLEWQAALADVEPSAASVLSTLSFSPGEPIFPARRAEPLATAREDAHVFRALDDLTPRKVRCVLLGQDPFPLTSRATGRSFEQGESSDWASLKCTSSLAGLVRHLAEHRTGDPSFRGAGGLRRAVASAEVKLEEPRQLFDRWQHAGVLCLNTGLTLTRYRKGGAPEQIHGHIPFWIPVVHGILHHLANREESELVILLMGRIAHAAADASGLRKTAEANGRWSKSIAEVRVNHPSYTSPGPNPFTEVNNALENMNVSTINW